MQEVLQDIIKYVGSLGLFSTIRVTGTKDEVTFETVDDKRSIILNAKLKTPDAAFDGVFGVGDLARLGAYLNHPNFKDSSNSSLTIIKDNRNGKVVPTTIKFENKNLNSKVEHRLMDAELIPEAKYVGKAWDVTFTPSKSKIQEFASFASIESAREEFFMPKTENDNLVIYFGEPGSATHSASMVFENAVAGKLTKSLYWSTANATQILKLGQDKGVEVSITENGAILFKIESDYVEYRYYMRAHRK